MLESVAENVWCHEVSFQTAGIDFGGRMTVVRLSDGGLFLHSPTKPDEAVLQSLRELGPVKALVGPNLFHHLYLRDYKEAFPEAKLYAAPGLEKKRKNLAFDFVLEGGQTYEFSGEIDHIVCEGAPRLSEVVFLHKPSGTLILTDLVFNFAEIKGLMSKVAFAVTNIRPGLSQSRLISWVTKDRAKSRASAEKILEWDFDRILVCHGEVCASDAKAGLRAALGL